MAVVHCDLQECEWNVGCECEEQGVVLRRPDVVAGAGTVEGWVVCESFERRDEGPERK